VSGGDDPPTVLWVQMDEKRSISTPLVELRMDTWKAKGYAVLDPDLMIENQISSVRPLVLRPALRSALLP
jgi:hypothetical protein